jgi:hypothetical protein
LYDGISPSLHYWTEQHQDIVKKFLQPFGWTKANGLDRMMETIKQERALQLKEHLMSEFHDARRAFKRVSANLSMQFKQHVALDPALLLLDEGGRHEFEDKYSLDLDCLSLANVQAVVKYQPYVHLRQLAYFFEMTESYFESDGFEGVTSVEESATAVIAVLEKLDADATPLILPLLANAWREARESADFKKEWVGDAAEFCRRFQNNVDNLPQHYLLCQGQGVLYFSLRILDDFFNIGMRDFPWENPQVNASTILVCKSFSRNFVLVF